MCRQFIFVCTISSVPFKLQLKWNFLLTFLFFSDIIKIKTEVKTMAIKIMLDAGHYANYNRSPVVKEYWESHMTWKLHLLLKSELEKYGFEVFTTREKQEVDMPVYNRGLSAEGCDLFISLHSNACDSEPVNRVDVYASYDNINNSHVLGGKFAAAISEMMQVSGGYVKTKKGTSGEYYGVLRGARKVGVPLYYIIEHSFHTNKKATEWLLKDENLERLALLEAGIIAGYYGIELLEKEHAKGDIDGDGKLTAVDYMLLKRAVLGTITLTEEQEKIADVNGDGKVDAIDYMLLKRAILGTYEI